MLQVQFQIFLFYIIPDQHPKPQRIALACCILHTRDHRHCLNLENGRLYYNVLESNITNPACYEVLLDCCFEHCKALKWTIKNSEVKMSLTKQWDVFSQENVDINLNIHICWTQTVTRPHLRDLVDSMALGQLKQSVHQKKSQSNSCVLNYSCRFTSILFPFLTPLELTNVCICAHSLSNSSASTKHWQSKWTASKFLEMHSAYDVNEATVAITKHDSYMNR